MDHGHPLDAGSEHARELAEQAGADDHVVRRGAGDVKGEEYWFDGEHPQMGKLRVHAKFIVANGRLYLVQALHAADAADFAALGDKFVGSFKLR